MAQSTALTRRTDRVIDQIECAVATTSSHAFRETLAFSFLCRWEVRANNQSHRHFQPAARVVILSGATARTERIVNALSRTGMVPLVLSSGYGRIANRDKTFGHFAQYCIVDADHVAEKTDLIQFCRNIRTQNKEVPIILTSSAFEHDDITQERSQLCDASLAGTFTIDSLQRVISAAASNNLATRLSSYQQI